MTKRFNLFLVIAALLIALPYYWFLLDNSGSQVPAKPVSMAQLRALAQSMPGARPHAIEIEVPAFQRLPGNLLVAGSGIKRKLVAYMAFRLPVAGGKPIMIESGLAASDAQAIGAEQFKPDVAARVNRALGQAGLILVTHEHPDHLGALVAHGGTALMQAARLNPNQLPPSLWAARLPWRSGEVPPPRLGISAPQAVAPGVVVIPAPGSHTPGSQMIYVQLANGREYLFAGDIASFAQNWQDLRGRSRLIETWFAPQNRAEVFAWLHMVRALKADTPGLTIVPGHDYEWLQDPFNHTGVTIGFKLTEP